MFESVAPGAFIKRRRGAFYALLPASLAVHGIAIGAALLGAIWTVTFPTESPLLVTAYSLVEIPKPPPPPPAAPRNDPAVKPQKPVPVEKIVAPTIIPETIPKVPDMPQAELASIDSGPGVEGGIPGTAAPPVQVTETVPPPPPPRPPAPPDDGRVYVPLGKDLPMEAVSQEFPPYPADAKRLGLEDQVIIRYTIGKNGRVIDVQILSHANFGSFDAAVLQTVPNWRFRPLIRNGKPVEVTHDLGINFELVTR